MRLFVFLSVLFLFTFYVARWFTGARRVGLRTFLVAGGLFFLALGWQFAYRWGVPLTSPFTRAYFWISAFFFGYLAVLLALAIPLDLSRLFLFLLSKVFPKNQRFDPSRRAMFRRWGTVGVLGTAGVFNVVGAVQAVAGPVVREVPIPVDNLPPDLEGFRIVQVSDLHIGPTLQGEFLNTVVEKVNALNPDLIAITGDFADGSVEVLRSYVTGLKNLKSTHGSFYVTGNHEYYWGALDWLKEVASHGVTPLVNENRAIVHKGARLLVAGVPDTSAHQFFPSHESKPLEAVRSLATSEFKLLLAHRPQSCFEAEAAGFDFQLSGHTHAGQFFPWSLVVRFAHPYYKGLNRHGRMWVYVNSGTGYWGPPNRFMVPSEITLLTLTKRKGA